MTTTTALVIQAGVVLLVAYGGAVLRMRAARDLLEPGALVSAITGSLFALPAFDLLSSEDRLFQAGAHAALSRVLLVVLAALIAFHLAFWAWSRRSATMPPREGVAELVPLVARRTVIWLLCAGAVVSAVVLELGAHAIVGHWQNPLALTPTDQLPWWYFFALGGLCLAQLAFWLALASSLASRGRLATWPVAYTGALALLLSATQGRMMIVNLVIPAVLLIHYHRRRLNAPMLVGTVVLALIYFLVWDGYREAQAGSGQGPSGLALSPSGVWRGVANNLDYTDSFVRLVLEKPSPAWGQTYLAPATKPAPRSVWPEKPLGGNSLLTDIIFPGRRLIGYSRASSAITEGYLNFGVLGPPFVYALLGVATAALVRWHGARRMRPDATLVYAVAIIGLLTFVRTDAQIATTFLGYYLLPLLTIALLTRIQSGAARRPSAAFFVK